MSNPDLHARLVDAAILEKRAIGFVDDYINSCDGAQVLTSDVFKRLNYLPSPKEIREYVGYDPCAVTEFIACRSHVWRLKNEEVYVLPVALRDAIVDLVATVVKNRNRALLGEILVFLQTHHIRALPYLPTPTSGSSAEAVKNFILDFPSIFRLINEDDGDEWTRTTPRGHVAVECRSSVVEGVILLNVSPVFPSSSPSSSSGHQPQSSQVDSSSQARGIGEIVRITPAWGYLQSETHGPIFFTSSACGNQNLHSNGFKLGQSVAYEANCSEDSVQMFNNVPVKWRAFVVRHLTAAERDAPVGLLAAHSGSPELDVASPTQDQPRSSSSNSVRATASGTTSPSANLDSAAMKRLPSSLADWVKKRQVHTERVSPRQSPLSQLAEQTDRLAIGTNELQSTSAGRESYGANASCRNDQQTYVEQRPYYGQETAGQQGSTIFVNGASYQQQREVGVQTEVTDEELVLRLLRTAPEILDLFRVVMRE